MMYHCYAYTVECVTSVGYLWPMDYPYIEQKLSQKVIIHITSAVHCAKSLFIYIIHLHRSSRRGVHGYGQRHILRDRRPITTACLDCRAMGLGTNEVKQYMVRKKISFTGPTRAAKAGQNLQYRHDEPIATMQSRKDPPHKCTPWVPIFNTQQGPPSLVSLVLRASFSPTGLTL